MKPQNFSKNLTNILDALGLSQSQLAERSGLTRAAVSQILSGKREPTLKTICAILSVIPASFEQLLKESERKDG